MEFQKLCILGLGYIGLPTASTFATHGFDVIGVDVNSSVVNKLKNGEVHIYEPGLRTLVQAAVNSGKLVVSEAPQEADVFIIAVPTPFYADNKKADMRFVVSATESILPYLRKGNLIILESTSPPRTTADLVAPILEKSGLKAGEDFLLAYSPERVLPGQIIRELVENARVIGGINQDSAEAGRDLYASFVKGDIILTDSTTAEMVKLMENTYRDVNIAIANEFSHLADRFGIDVWEAISIANLHPRVNILQPGPGVGGHCISVDPWFLVEKASDITPLIHTARNVNDAQPEFVVQLVKRAAGGSLEGRSVCVLGLTYKPDVDDFRESPAVDVARLLAKAGTDVTTYDPYQPSHDLEGLHFSNDFEKAAAEAELLILLVGHQEFRKMTPENLKRLTKARILVDAVHAWSGDEWEKAGFSVFELGVRKKK